jgi:ATPase, YjeE family
MVDGIDFLEASFATDSPEATRDAACSLGTLCRGGEVLLLIGDLGSGKTCFTQGLARGLDVPADIRVTSPTFTLHAEYPGRLVLNHLDLYRLDEPCQMEGLGVEDMLGDRDAVAAVEWPEMLADGVGRERLEIRIADTGDNRRSFALTAHGPRHVELLENWVGERGR